MEKCLINPHGEELINLIVSPKRADELAGLYNGSHSWNLSRRQTLDLELLLNGGLSPLKGFMCHEDNEAVCNSMRLSSGLLWPLPIVLDVTDEFAGDLEPGKSISLHDREGVILAVLHIEDIWKPDRMADALTIFGVNNPDHSGVNNSLYNLNPWCVEGRVEGIQLPAHYDFPALRLTPAELVVELRKAYPPPPEHADVIIDTTNISDLEAVDRIINYLIGQGYIRINRGTDDVH